MSAPPNYASLPDCHQQLVRRSSPHVKPGGSKASAGEIAAARHQVFMRLDNDAAGSAQIIVACLAKYVTLASPTSSLRTSHEPSENRWYTPARVRASTTMVPMAR